MPVCNCLCTRHQTITPARSKEWDHGGTGVRPVPEEEIFDNGGAENSVEIQKNQQENPGNTNPVFRRLNYDRSKWGMPRSAA